MSKASRAARKRRERNRIANVIRAWRGPTVKPTEDGRWQAVDSGGNTISEHGSTADAWAALDRADGHQERDRRAHDARKGTGL